MALRRSGSAQVRLARVELPSLKAGVRKPTRTPIACVHGVDRRFSPKAVDVSPPKKELLVVGAHQFTVRLTKDRLAADLVVWWLNSTQQQRDCRSRPCQLPKQASKDVRRGEMPASIVLRRH